MWLAVIGFVIGLLTGAMVSIVCIFRENGKWSIGWKQGYNVARKRYTDYDKGFKDGVNASYKAMEEVTIERYLDRLKKVDNNADEDKKREVA